tara:strand:+ start:328 stop:567 length:240 start_codon:yes stop_codon:yes gene_type:complete
MALEKLASHSVGNVTKWIIELMPSVMNPPRNIIKPDCGIRVISVTKGAAMRIKAPILCAGAMSFTSLVLNESGKYFVES